MKRFLSLLVLFLVASMFAAPAFAVGFNTELQTAAEDDLDDVATDQQNAFNLEDAAYDQQNVTQSHEEYYNCTDETFLQHVDHAENWLQDGQAYMYGGYLSDWETYIDPSAYDLLSSGWQMLYEADYEYEAHCADEHDPENPGDPWGCYGGTPQSCWDFVNGADGYGVNDPYGRCGWIGASTYASLSSEAYVNAGGYYSDSYAAWGWAENRLKMLYPE